MSRKFNQHSVFLVSAGTDEAPDTTEPFELLWNDQEFYRMLEQDAHTAETRLDLTSVEADLQYPILPPHGEGSLENYFMLAHVGADEMVQGIPEYVLSASLSDF
jgi:hypothetical protein